MEIVGNLHRHGAMPVLGDTENETSLSTSNTAENLARSSTVGDDAQSAMSSTGSSHEDSYEIRLQALTDRLKYNVEAVAPGDTMWDLAYTERDVVWRDHKACMPENWPKMQEWLTDANGPDFDPSKLVSGQSVIVGPGPGYSCESAAPPGVAPPQRVSSNSAPSSDNQRSTLNPIGSLPPSMTLTDIITNPAPSPAPGKIFTSIGEGDCLVTPGIPGWRGLMQLSNNIEFHMLLEASDPVTVGGANQVNPPVHPREYIGTTHQPDEPYVIQRLLDINAVDTRLELIRLYNAGELVFCRAPEDSIAGQQSEAMAGTGLAPDPRSS